MTFQSALNDDTRQTVWFNSRFCRANLIWEHGTLRVRDIHLFDQSVASPIVKQKVEKPSVEFHTLPIVDGYYWSSQYQLAGLQVKVRLNGEEVTLTGKQPDVSQAAPGELRIEWPLTTVTGELVITLTDESIHVALQGAPDVEWWLQLVTADNVDLPFFEVEERLLTCAFKETEYSVGARQGTFKKHSNGFLVRPEQSELTLQLSPSVDANFFGDLSR